MNSKEGILLVDKPSGFTSHDVVAFVRKRFNFRKVGHAGTLDPMATGLLILLLEGFTKRSVYFSNYDKEYKSVLRLGISTDTGDKEGNITEEKDPGNINLEKLKEVFSSFRGKIKQIPPMYSAKKIKGKKLYELARKGKVLKRDPKELFIEKLEILDVALPDVTFYVKCSKGTYIRQLAHDIGESLGCGAHLISLERTKIGPFSLEEAVKIESLKEKKDIIDENILQPR